MTISNSSRAILLIVITALLGMQLGCVRQIDKDLVIASSDGDIEAVRKLLAGGADPDVTALEWTPLTRAAMKGHREIVILLVENGADVNIQAPGGGTPLFWAASYNQLDVAKELIARGAAIKPHSKGSSDPLTVAVGEGFYEITELLMQNGADPNRVDYEGNTALGLAKKKGDKRFVDVLKIGRARHDQNNRGQTTNKFTD